MNRVVAAMSQSLNCVFQPKGQKGKAPEKVVHPYSRKAAYLAREENRLKRKERCVDNRKCTWCYYRDRKRFY